jgi:hypothetical protein
MAFNSIPQTWIASGKFAIQSLWQYIKDNFDYLYASIISGGGGGLLNGSFEVDNDADGVPDNWARALYSGGSGAYETTDVVEGGKAYKFTHPGGASAGGGSLTSTYFGVTPHRNFILSLLYKASVAGIKVMVQVNWYDKDQVIIGSTVTLYTSTANPTIWTLLVIQNAEVPATARYAKVVLVGGYTDTDVAGSVYFDDVRLHDAAPAAGVVQFADAQIDQAEVSGAVSGTYADLGSNQSITVPVGAKFLYLYLENRSGGGSPVGDHQARFKIGTNYSSETPVMSSYSYAGAWVFLDVSALQGAQTLNFQAKCADQNRIIRCPAANLKYCKGARIVVDAALGTTTTDAS